MGSQIFTRKCVIRKGLDRFKGLESDNERFLQYRNDVLALLDTDKSMISVSNLTADSHAKAEMLNIADFNKKFVTVIDFSDMLDAIPVSYTHLSSVLVVQLLSQHRMWICCQLSLVSQSQWLLRCTSSHLLVTLGVILASQQILSQITRCGHSC